MDSLRVIVHIIMTHLRTLNTQLFLVHIRLTYIGSGDILHNVIMLTYLGTLYTLKCWSCIFLRNKVWLIDWDRDVVPYRHWAIVYNIDKQLAHVYKHTTPYCGGIRELHKLTVIHFFHAYKQSFFGKWGAYKRLWSQFLFIMHDRLLGADVRRPQKRAAFTKMAMRRHL